MPDDIVPIRKNQRRGRGATRNPDGRFEPASRERIDDGWQTEPEDGEPGLSTTVTIEHPKRIISRNTSPDLPFDRSINPYRGCEHGCIYCYARPTHAYMNLSAGLDFESRLFAKPDAAALLEKELARPGYRCAPMALGTNTDPYQPIERRLRITREVIGLLGRARHPFTITTKSDLVLRDIDILAPLAKDNLVAVGISVTSLDRRLARLMEPRASAPYKRLAAIEALAAAGIRTFVQASPMIPGLNDPELEDILAAARQKGAASATCIILRLPGDVAELFESWLHENFPARAAKVMSLVRSTREGKNYDPRFGTRMTGNGPYAELIRNRFRLACQRLGFEREGKYNLRSDLFTPPRQSTRQLDLF